MPSRQPAGQPVQVVQPGQPVQYVVYERPRPRIAKGILVFLIAGLAGLIIFSMGQTVWGAFWRGWLVNLLILGVIYFVFL